MRMPQKVYDDIRLLKTFRERSGGEQPWFMGLVSKDSELLDTVNITDKNKNTLFTVDGGVEVASYICFLNNLLTNLIKEVENKYDES